MLANQRCVTSRDGQAHLSARLTVMLARLGLNATFAELQSLQVYVLLGPPRGGF